MILYAESSAVLAWLLRQADGARVESLLADATFAATSDLTLVECDRALCREVALGQMSQARVRQLRNDLAAAIAKWQTIRLLPSIIQRAREPFACDPIRSLDALHVASALHARIAHTDVIVLTLDSRIKRAAESVGLSTLPD